MLFMSSVCICINIYDEGNHNTESKLEEKMPVTTVATTPDQYRMLFKM